MAIQAGGVTKGLTQQGTCSGTAYVFMVTGPVVFWVRKRVHKNEIISTKALLLMPESIFCIAFLKCCLHAPKKCHSPGNMCGSCCMYVAVCRHL